MNGLELYAVNVSTLQKFLYKNDEYLVAVQLIEK